MRCVHEQTRTGSHELNQDILTPETNLADHSMMQRGVRLYIAACFVRARMKTITGYQGRGRAAGCGMWAAGRGAVEKPDGVGRSETLSKTFGNLGLRPWRNIGCFVFYKQESWHFLIHTTPRPDRIKNSRGAAPSGWKHAPVHGAITRLENKQPRKGTQLLLAMTATLILDWEYVFLLAPVTLVGLKEMHNSNANTATSIFNGTRDYTIYSMTLVRLKDMYILTIF
jgi:hypothetical protein